MHFPLRRRPADLVLVVPVQTGPAHPRLPAEGQVWRPLRPDHSSGVPCSVTGACAQGADPLAIQRWKTATCSGDHAPSQGIVPLLRRSTPPLLRSELLDDATLGSFRPFHGFQGSNVPVPPDIAAALAERAASRLVTLPRPGEGGHPAGAAKRSGRTDQ